MHINISLTISMQVSLFKSYMGSAIWTSVYIESARYTIVPFGSFIKYNKEFGYAFYIYIE